MKLSERIKSKLVKVNFTSILFFAVSLISITLAWFAYTNTVSSDMNIDLKAWNVKITRNNTEVNNTFTINIADLYPGSPTFDETYTIHNTGDLAAKVSYNIKGLRVLNDYYFPQDVSFAKLERDFPFVLSFTHGSRYLAPGSTSTFNVNCQWPLDSGNDALDAQYGQRAYEYYQNYPGQPGMEVQIEIVISQYIDETNSFSTDSWDTIELAVEKGDTSKYNVGDTKTISMDVDGNGTNETYTLRLANKNSPTTPCSGSSNSQTACGFVVEFVNIIEKRSMNPTGTNVGGYPASELYSYINTTLESKLPIDLQNVLAKTRVVSGYGSTDSTNFTSTNKLFLMSGIEVVGSDSNDTAASTTRQLDYYEGKSTSDRIKKYNGSNAWYWLRPAFSISYASFRCVASDGRFDYGTANISTRGVAPAFRIV